MNKLLLIALVALPLTLLSLPSEDAQANDLTYMDYFMDDSSFDASGGAGGSWGFTFFSMLGTEASARVYNDGFTGWHPDPWISLTKIKFTAELDSGTFQAGMGELDDVDCTNTDRFVGFCYDGTMYAIAADGTTYERTVVDIDPFENHTYEIRNWEDRTAYWVDNVRVAVHTSVRPATSDWTMLSLAVKGYESTLWVERAGEYYYRYGY